MTKDEFTLATQLASRRKGLKWVDLDVFDGFGLRGYMPRAVTLTALADLIRYQTFRMNGEIDQEALNEIWQARHKFIVVNDVVTLPQPMTKLEDVAI